MRLVDRDVRRDARRALPRGRGVGAGFGLANAYSVTLGIAAMPTVLASSVRGVSRTVDHAVNGSTGAGMRSR